MKALDMSFAAAQVTPAWCEARLAEGYRLLIVDAWLGASRPEGVERALYRWRMAGGLTAAYYVPHAYRPATAHLREAQVSIGAEWEHLQFVAIDVEDIRSKEQIEMGIMPMDEQWNVAHLRESAELVQAHEQRPCIYTGRGQWAALGNPTDLSDLPLWDASYGQVPGLAMQPEYGGWAVRIGHQHTNTTNVDGLDCDLNLFDEAWVLNATQPAQEGQQQPSEPAPDEVAALHVRWAEAAALRAQADALNEQAGSIEAEVIARKVALGLQPA
jgi:hypothetical protein